MQNAPHQERLTLQQVQAEIKKINDAVQQKERQLEDNLKTYHICTDKENEQLNQEMDDLAKKQQGLYALEIELLAQQAAEEEARYKEAQQNQLNELRLKNKTEEENALNKNLEQEQAALKELQQLQAQLEQISTTPRTQPTNASLPKVTNAPSASLGKKIGLQALIMCLVTALTALLYMFGPLPLPIIVGIGAITLGTLEFGNYLAA